MQIGAYKETTRFVGMPLETVYGKQGHLETKCDRHYNTEDSGTGGAAKGVRVSAGATLGQVVSHYR